ncbi:MAG: hypothetical protein ACREEE_05565 [Dongiaceae bacterium]
MYATIDALRDIAGRCQTNEPLSQEQLHLLGRAFREFLTHRARTIDEAFGLRFARGGVPWWLEEAMRHRNRALRELARNYYSELTVSAQARQIQTLSIRYAASAWRFDRTRGAMPDHYAGTANEWLYRAFSAGAPMPICERQLRLVLGR